VGVEPTNGGFAVRFTNATQGDPIGIKRKTQYLAVSRSALFHDVLVSTCDKFPYTLLR